MGLPKLNATIRSLFLKVWDGNVWIPIERRVVEYEQTSNTAARKIRVIFPHKMIKSCMDLAWFGSSTQACKFHRFHRLSQTCWSRIIEGTLPWVCGRHAAMILSPGLQKTKDRSINQDTNDHASHRCLAHGTSWDIHCRDGVLHNVRNLLQAYQATATARYVDALANGPSDPKSFAGDQLESGILTSDHKILCSENWIFVRLHVQAVPHVPATLEKWLHFCWCWDEGSRTFFPATTDEAFRFPNPPPRRMTLAFERVSCWSKRYALPKLL